MDWGVYDSRSASMVTENVYAEAFARRLAKAMNWAFEQGERYRDNG